VYAEHVVYIGVRKFELILVEPGAIINNALMLAMYSAVSNYIFLMHQHTI